ncbi:imelysin family protein [Lewinella sp. IMCC34191]|uniref:imelysin family protein n=1 Tax=Lewinella sp. IMCC34191 TaxID=2259172 RepID=UPI000E228DE6|nr:imelysin family protein [Lewinella sp. IMCC34191]
MKPLHLILFAFSLTFLACDPQAGDDDPDLTDNFDREAMLAHWADNVIGPAVRRYDVALADLDMATTVYQANPNDEHLDSVRVRFERAYLAWQRVDLFAFRGAEDSQLRERTNTYPTDTARLLTESDANLELPSNFDVQGFPALDFLLYGTPDPETHKDRIAELVKRIQDPVTPFLLSWEGNSRDSYVENSGSSANASVDRTVNHFIFYYEKYLRAGKVGIPAGVFSSDPMPMLAEAPYHGELSKSLFLEALAASEDFFTTSPGLAEYLDVLGVERDGQPLSARIKAGFADARAAASGLDADFATQVEDDNTEMLQLYDALQRNVILLKVDMLQALNISVDYVDADGD